MAFWSKFFNQAGQIESLLRDIEFEKRKNGELQSLLEREEFRNNALEKEIIKARNSELRTLRHHADVMSKTVKTQSSFALIAKEDEPKEVPVDTELEQKIRWAAETARQMDIDEGFDPAPLEIYEQNIRQNPSKYIFH